MLFQMPCRLPRFDGFVTSVRRRLMLIRQMPLPATFTPLSLRRRRQRYAAFDISLPRRFTLIVTDKRSLR